MARSCGHLSTEGLDTSWLNNEMLDNELTCTVMKDILVKKKFRKIEAVSTENIESSPFWASS